MALQGRVKEQVEAMAWLPPEHRADYEMMRNKKIPADEARRIICDHIIVLARRNSRNSAQA